MLSPDVFFQDSETKLRTLDIFSQKFEFKVGQKKLFHQKKTFKCHSLLFLWWMRSKLTPLGPFVFVFRQQPLKCWLIWATVVQPQLQWLKSGKMFYVVFHANSQVKEGEVPAEGTTKTFCLGVNLCVTVKGQGCTIEFISTAAPQVKSMAQ